MSKEDVNDVYKLIMEQRARIEALEAALRNINDICHDPNHEAACMATVTVARIALEQDK